MVICPMLRGERHGVLEPLRHHAERVFGCKVKAAGWMMHPRAAFEGLSALDYAQSDLTYQHVIEELKLIKHGFAF
jgi:uncharacterized protein (DUF2384 family)